MSTRPNAQLAQRTPADTRGLDPRKAGATAEALVLRIVEATEEAVRQIREDTERALAEETEAILAEAERQAALIGGNTDPPGVDPDATHSRPERFHGLHAVPGPSLEPEFARGVAAQVRAVVDEAVVAAEETAEAIRAEAAREAVQIRTRARAEADAALAEAERRAEAMRGEADTRADAARVERRQAEALAAESAITLGRIASQITAGMVALERSDPAAAHRLAPLFNDASSAIARAGYEVGRFFGPASTGAHAGRPAAPAAPVPAAAPAAPPAVPRSRAPLHPRAERAPHPYGPAYRADPAAGPFVRWQARFPQHASRVAPEPRSRQAARLGA